ncbi:MAG: hypothetical protein FJ271_10435 [Planctomycetes bacterium]|nr:hypothetical protein [Planctomycetota bacterium]
MRNLLALAAAAVIAFVVVGYFQGWYAVKRTTDGTGTRYEVDVNNPKIAEDINKAKEKARTWLTPGTNSGTAPQQVIRPTPPELPSGTPTSFKTTSDGTIVYPSIPAPPPLPISPPPVTTPPGLPQR